MKLSSTASVIGISTPRPMYSAAITIMPPVSKFSARELCEAGANSSGRLGGRCAGDRPLCPSRARSHMPADANAVRACMLERRSERHLSPREESRLSLMQTPWPA
jgi:hypothetical protein